MSRIRSGSRSCCRTAGQSQGQLHVVHEMHFSHEFGDIVVGHTDSRSEAEGSELNQVSWVNGDYCFIIHKGM